MKIIECPRDAMQGIATFIPTAKKIDYLNALLAVGFDTLDFGSFVSPKAIPQMRDTADVLRHLQWQGSPTKLLAIVANLRGAQEACQHEGIAYLGYPLSISDTFQRRNTNKSIPEALSELEQIYALAAIHHKKVVTYISMGFGNPYGDPYEPALVHQFVDVLRAIGADTISIADTVGVAGPSEVANVFATVHSSYPQIEFGVHLHARPEHSRDLIKSAYRAGCRRFDGALKGFGGCPMANDELVGNMATETILECLREEGSNPDIRYDKLDIALQKASEIFSNA